MEQKNQTVVELQVQKLKDMWNALSQTSKTLTINGGIGIVIVAVLAMTGVLNQGSLYGDILGGANSVNDFDADTCGNSGPMCGVNDRTYSNACDIEEAGIKLRHAGMCQTKSGNLQAGYGYSACRKTVFEKLRKIGFKRTIAIKGAHQMCYEKGLGAGYGYGGNSPQRGLCSRKYQPVCGVNDVTYGNACLASMQNGVAVKSQGVCPVVPSSLPNFDDTLDDLLDNGNQTLRAWQIDIDNAYPRTTEVGTKNFLLGKVFVESQGKKPITAVLLKIVSPDNSNPFLNLRMRYKNQEIGSEATFFSPGIVLVRFKNSFKLTPGDNTLSFYADIADKKMENIHIYLDRIERNNVHFNPPLNSVKLSTVYIRESLSAILNGLLNTGKQQPPVSVPSTGNDLGQILNGLMAVSVTKNDGLSDKQIIRGSANKDVFGIIIQAGKDFDLNFTRFVFTNLGGKGMENLVSLQLLRNGAVIDSANLISNGASGSVTFNNFGILKVAKNTAETILVRATFSTSINAGKTLVLSLSTGGIQGTDQNGNSLSPVLKFAPVASSVFTIKDAGSLNLLSNGTVSTKALLGPNADVNALSFDVSAQDEDIRLTDFYLSLVGNKVIDIKRIAKVSLMDGGKEILQGSQFEKGIRFNFTDNSQEIIAKGTTKTYVVRIQLNAPTNKTSYDATTLQLEMSTKGIPAGEVRAGTASNGVRGISLNAGSPVVVNGTSVSPVHTVASVGFVIAPVGPNNGFNGSTTAYKFKITPTTANAQLKLNSVTIACENVGNAQGQLMYGDTNSINDIPNQLSKPSSLNGEIKVTDSQAQLAKFSSEKTFTIALTTPMPAGAKKCGVTDINISEVFADGSERIIGKTNVFGNVGFNNMATALLDGGTPVSTPTPAPASTGNELGPILNGPVTDTTIIATSPVVVSPFGTNNGFNRSTTAYKFQITPKDSTKQYQLKSVQMSCAPNTNEVYVMNGDTNTFSDLSNQLTNPTKLSEVLVMKDSQKPLAMFSSPKIFTVALVNPIMSVGETSCGIKEITIVDVSNGQEFALSTYPDSGFSNLTTATLR